MKRIIIYSIVALIIISSIAVAVVFALGSDKNTLNATKTDGIELKFEGESEFTVNLGDEIPHPIVKVYINGELTDRECEIVGSADNSYPGVYEIKYILENHELISNITVVDNIPPVIKLIGNEKTIVLEGESYQERGYEARDNIDGDLTEKVEISGEVKTALGTYTLDYTVVDSSGNSVSVTRTVVVNKKLAPKQAPAEKKDPPKKTEETANNEITSMSFTSTGINVSVKHSSDIESFSLVNTTTGNATKYQVSKSGLTYTSFLSLTELSNGSYDLFLNTKNTQEKMVNKLDFLYRIGRAKVGSKLVTANYNNNNVNITIENHSYKYDIVIDAGHGGGDPGAVNNYIYEKNMNLEISLYERDRYREHGINVLLTRNGDAVEIGMGPNELVELQRRAYALGYYGAVSRFVYSNHHNSIGNNYYKGYEILVPATLSSSELAVEHAVANAWDSIYDLSGDNHTRFYTRNYDTDRIFSKRNGEVYSFNNWYAINRVPYNLFNVKATIYEGCYISNPADFEWYWNQKNWIFAAEAKIKAYVEALGKTYIPRTND